MTRPRILYLTPASPAGRPSGSQLRVRQIGKALQEIGDVHFVIVGFEIPANGASARNEFAIDRSFALEPVREQSGLTRLRSAFLVKNINPYGHAADTAAQSWIGEQLQDFDLIWIHTLRTAGALGRWEWPKSVIDVDDVPSVFLDNEAAGQAGPAQGMRLRFQSWMARRREQLLSDRFTVVTVCSEHDRRYLNLPGPVHVIPNGFPVPQNEPVRNPAQPPRIGFIGTFDYAPNVEGVRWFVENCWSGVKREVPDAELRIIGTNRNGTEVLNGPDIKPLGYLDSAASEIATWSAMIVPIRQGAGTRVKIADGFSKKVPMVTTSLGVSGYDVTDGVELLIADTPAEFAADCVRAIRDTDKSREMAERGWTRFLNEWSWDAIRPRIWAAAEDCLKRSASPESALAAATS